MLRLTCRQRHQFNDPDYARAALWSSILELDGQAIQATQAGLAQIGDAALKTLYFTRHFPNITNTLQRQFDIVASNVHLAQVFVALQLQDLSVQIDNSSLPRHRATLVEAIIGAVFLDSGLNMTVADSAISAMRIFDIGSELSDEPQPRVTYRDKRRSRSRREREPVVTSTVVATKSDASSTASKPFAQGAQIDSNLLRPSPPEELPASGSDEEISRNHIKWLKRSRHFLGLASTRPGWVLRGLGGSLSTVSGIQSLMKKHSERKQCADPGSLLHTAEAMRTRAYEKLLRHKRQNDLAKAQTSDLRTPTNTYAQYHI
ncbi:uncharacterized protein RHO25_012725 [Cercospora beticola]|uniref:RNase III domain-containing protein n=2 Tax=Cercospora beticola TaxID=122368 RepID=A0ABZ0P8S6_CERBT|nr:hypothetical protein RHO25_012725 [Cercospora beticola]